MTHSADFAFLAVENSFLDCLIVVEGAGFTIVESKFFVALDACFTLRLLFVASQALHVSDFEPIKLMVELGVLHIIVHFFIVANSAWIVFSFANFVRTLQLAFTQVVLASEVPCLQFDLSASYVCG